MAATFSSTLTIKSKATGANTNELATLRAEGPHELSKPLTAGTGSGNIDFAYSKTGTLAAGVPLDIDLDDSAVTEDLFGTLGAFASVKKLIVENTGSTNGMTVSGDFLGISTEAIDIGLGALVIYYGPTGRTVTATTADVISLTSASGTTYKVTIEGVKT